MVRVISCLIRFRKMHIFPNQTLMTALDYLPFLMVMEASSAQNSARSTSPTSYGSKPNTSPGRISDKRCRMHS